MEQESLKKKTIKGVGWSAIDNVSGYAVTFVVGIILARILSPEDYGLIGIIAIFTAICQCFINAGFGSALIRKKEATDEDLHNLDYYIFHQANSFINNYIAKKMKLDKNKIPSTIEKFGNTSSVSVPLTIASELKDKLQGNKRLMLSAFGVGMAWATAFVPFVDCKIIDIVEI